MSIIREGTGTRWLTVAASAIVISFFAIALWLAGAFGGAHADGGDFQLDLVSAEPTTYEQRGGSEGDEKGTSDPLDLGYDDRTINVDVVEQLEAIDFECEDRIIFFTRVTVDSGASDTDQTIVLTYHFDARNNGQQAVGYSEVLDVGRSAIDFSGQTGDDGNMALDGNESVSLLSQQYLNKPQNNPTGSVPGDFGNADAEILEAVVRVDGLDPGDQLIVRVDVRFSCFATDVTGNLHGALIDAFFDADGNLATTNDQEALSRGSGNQDIPMLGLGKLATPTPNPTPTPTATSTPTPTATSTSTPTPTATSTSTPTPTATSTSTPTPTATSTSTPTPTATSTSTPTPTATSTSTPTPTATSTSTPTPTATSTSTPTPTATSTSTPTPTATSTSTPTPTATSTSTPTPTATSTSTPTPTATSTSTPTPTATSTSTPTPTATSTSTPTPTATSTSTPTPTATSTSTPTPTATSTSTPTPTATSTSTPTPTATSTSTPTPTATSTSTPTPTATSTSTPTPTATSTSTPTPTATSTSTPTPTSTSTSTATATATFTAVPTVVLPQVLPPTGGLAGLAEDDSALILLALIGMALIGGSAWVIWSNRRWRDRRGNSS